MREQQLEGVWGSQKKRYDLLMVVFFKFSGHSPKYPGLCHRSHLSAGVGGASVAEVNGK